MIAIAKEPWEYAIKYLGAKFMHMGRSPTHMDCVGLIALTMRDMGREVVDSPYYGREPARNNNSFQLHDYIEMNFGPPVTRPLRGNDIILLKLRPRLAPAHVAIVAPHPHGLGMIHTYGEIGKVVYHRIDDHRMAQIVEVFQWAPQE